MKDAWVEGGGSRRAGGPVTSTCAAGYWHWAAGSTQGCRCTRLMSYPPPKVRGMTATRLCEMCNTALPARNIPGHPALTCSPECKEARVKMLRKKRYAANRGEAIRNAREWVMAHPERAAERRRRWREANKESIRQSKRAWAAANAENIAAGYARWYAANRERIRAAWLAKQTDVTRALAVERTRKWMQDNPEWRKENRRKWAKANPEKVATIAQRRRARQRKAPAELVTLADLLAEQVHTCYLCDLPIDPERKYPDALSASVDHVIPLSRGGSGLRENLRAAHLGCNVAKGDRLIQEMFRSMRPRRA
jgi:5-methylcytosine-specific restriction endonuclease McrA